VQPPTGSGFTGSGGHGTLLPFFHSRKWSVGGMDSSMSFSSTSQASHGTPNVHPHWFSKMSFTTVSMGAQSGSPHCTCSEGRRNMRAVR
jgi:hypothetical protein